MSKYITLDNLTLYNTNFKQYVKNSNNVFTVLEVTWDGDTHNDSYTLNLTQAQFDTLVSNKPVNVVVNINYDDGESFTSIDRVPADVTYQTIGNDIPAVIIKFQPPKFKNVFTLKEVSGYFSREDLSSGTYTLDYSQYNFQTSITSITGYDASKTQILKNVNGTLTWVDES